MTCKKQQYKVQNVFFSNLSLCKSRFVSSLHTFSHKEQSIIIRTLPAVLQPSSTWSENSKCWVTGSLMMIHNEGRRHNSDSGYSFSLPWIIFTVNVFYATILGMLRLWYRCFKVHIFVIIVHRFLKIYILLSFLSHSTQCLQRVQIKPYRTNVWIHKYNKIISDHESNGKVNLK